MREQFLLLSWILLGLLMFTSVVDAASQTITVEAGEEVIRYLDLKLNDEVSGRISVIGRSSNDINFSIIDPDGVGVISKQRISAEDFSFTSQKKGAYELHFNNSFSTEAKTVSFNYDVRHYIFGIPQEDFLVFVVMAVGVVGLLLFVALSRP